MAFNFNQIAKFVKVANGITNPKQAVNMLLDEINKRNPQIATQLKSAMQSGRKPADYLKEQVQKGNISKDDFEQVKEGYKMAQKFGLMKKIPNSTWTELENAINSSGTSNANTKNGFSGF